MLVKRIWLIIITFVLMIIMSVLIKNTIMAGVATFVIIVVVYIMIAFIRNKKRLSLLEEKCNPQSFIEATENQIFITGKNHKINTYLCIDKAAGLIVKGEFQEALSILNKIDKSSLSIKNGSLLAYTLNLILCLYELGDTTHAEEIFETQVPLLAPVSRRMVLAMAMLVAERYFYINKYDESKEHFQQLLKEKLSQRTRMEILFRLAQIDEINGNIIDAKQKFTEIAEIGGELWVALQARKCLEQI